MGKQYKMIKRLVDRITRSDAPLNNFFTYYGYKVYQYSGQKDYTSVTVRDADDKETLADFSFDFLTFDLVLEGYADDGVRMALVEAFADIYSPITVTDYLLDDRIKEINKVLDLPEEEYKDGWFDELRDKLAYLQSLPIHRVTRGSLTHA
ncbi:MAG: hypothetical protein J6Y37_15190 [Paludibacteraceae bacterium]|nr:hypothetical protein [Paludibacteraceae bacterium]